MSAAVPLICKKTNFEMNGIVARARTAIPAHISEGGDLGFGSRLHG